MLPDTSDDTWGGILRGDKTIMFLFPLTKIIALARIINDFFAGIFSYVR